MSRTIIPPDQLGPYPSSGGGRGRTVIVVIVLLYLTAVLTGLLGFGGYLLANDELTVATGTAVATVATAAAAATGRIIRAVTSLLVVLGYGARGGEAGAVA